MNFVDYILKHNKNGVIDIRIIPNAKNTQFSEIMANGVIKIKVAQPPENWKANKELMIFLSDNLRLKKDSIRIISWVTSQNKKIKLDIK